MKKLLSLSALALSLLATPMPAHAAKMALSPAEAELRASCLNTVSLIINTEGVQSNAADAFLSFNPDEIEVTGIGIGNVYKAYPGKVIGSGRIQITAFNDEGFFNGRGTLATLSFKSKPGVESTEINFIYSPGSSVDSNVADASANDVLTGVFGGRYTFKPGACTSDRTAPWLENESPKPGDITVPLDAPVTFLIKDNQSGVKLDSLKVQINDQIYTPQSPEMTTSRRGLGYEVTIQPAEPFSASAPVTVSVDAQDEDGNVMKQVKYSFNELMPVGACPKEEVRPAAPEMPDRMWLWILLIISLLVNVLLYIKDHPHVRKMQLETHPIPKTPKKRPAKRKK